MLQTGHGEREVLAPIDSQPFATSYEAKPTMPVIDGEVCYEALLGPDPGRVVPRLMFWPASCRGAAGHTYGANGIWQVNRKGRPYGKSPHGGNYGTIPWDEAMKLPGSGQLGLASVCWRSIPWHRFEPHPEWAAWRGDPPRRSLGRLDLVSRGRPGEGRPGRGPLLPQDVRSARGESSSGPSCA